MKASSIALGASLAAGSAAAAENPTTIYLFRHGEQQTTTTVVGDATSSYDAVWSGEDIAVVAANGTAVPASTAGGRNLDEVCGTARCAEELNPLGLLRADLLAEHLASIGVATPDKLDAAYASHLQRARQTAAPSAALAGLEGVVQLPSGGTELNPEGPSSSVCPTVEALRGHAAGSTVLVAAHTSTLYQIMGAGNDACEGLGVDLSDDAQFPKDDRGRVPREQYGNLWIVEIDGEGGARLRERHVLDFAMIASSSTGAAGDESGDDNPAPSPSSRALMHSRDYSHQIALAVGGFVLAVGGFILAN